MSCARCQRPISQDEVGLSCKLIGRNTREHYCLRCLSAMFRVPEETLAQMAEHFRQAGCTLFAPIGERTRGDGAG